MAQTGFTPIQLYRTTTASAVPVAGNLAAGELAINLTDKKLYAKDASNNVFLLADASSGSTTAANLAGGAAGSLPYQTGANATTFRAIGTAGQVLQVNSGATAPEWVSSSGTGNVARTTSPSFTTPILGTPQSVTLTNATGLPLSTGVTGTLAVANGGTGITSFGTGVATALGQNVTGSGGIALATSPSFTTPALGAATATSINGLTLTSSTGALTVANGKTLTANSTLTLAGVDGKTLTVNSSLTLTGTDATTMTFPTTSATLARTDAGQTFTGTNVFSSAPQVSTLTNTRVVYAGASGVLQDSANLTFDGTSLTMGGNPTLSAGTANGVLYLNGSKVVSSGSALVFDGTNVGIGTSSPAAKLDVAGMIYATAVYAQTIASVSSFSWNTATSSPAASSTNPYGGGAPVVTNIHRNMRRCLLADNGTVNYYLDESDSTLKADGSAAVLTGADGMVMVEIPAFYVKREVNGTIITWSVSDVPLSGFDLHPAFYKDGKDVKYRYYSAYDACVYDVGAASYISGLNYDNNASPNGQAVDVTASTGDKLASVSGVYPMVGLTRAEFRTIAANRGTGWRQLDYTLLAAVQLLYLIEYQTFYSQNNTGDGNTATTYAASSGTQSDNGGSEAGKSNSIGNASTNTTNGASSASRGVAWMSYRGIENFYGNEWNWADGVIVNTAGSVSADSATWHFTNNSADFSDTVSTNMTLITSSGQTNSDYPDALASVNNFFISTSGGGSSTTYTTDYWYGSTSADRVVYVSGNANIGAYVGAFVVFAGNAASVRSRSIGARLAF